jgi:NAD(P)-dependent dehydrogenase (short-subunit alcohol dehydrogenase family)
MKKRFEGKVVLITGGSAGIGRTTLLKYSEEGAKVINADIMVKEGQEAVEEVRKNGGEALFVKTDVSVEKEVEALLKTIVEKFGRLDIAFNNAGIEEPNPGKMHTLEEKDWQRVIDVNQKGVWLCMKHELKQFMKQGEGVIVNAASMCGLVACLNVGSYVASKHAVVGLTKTAAMDYAKDNIRINAVCPGCVPTGQVMRVTRGDPEELKRLENAQPIGRMGTTEEIANAVLFLSSKESSFMTGHAMAVDGGATAQ